jgi:hypothetical protein
VIQDLDINDGNCFVVSRNGALAIDGLLLLLLLLHY